MTEKPNNKVLDSFGLHGEPQFLSGSEERTFRVGNAVLRHIKNTSADMMIWIANLSENVSENGFRIAKPLKTKKGNYINEDGWTAWTFLEGHHQFTGHVPKSIAAMIAFHNEIKNIEKPPFMDKIDDPFTRAEKYAWEDPPREIMPEFQKHTELLYSLRKPVTGLKNQIIHGDLNPNNILLAPGLAPGIIDISPTWAPAEFALAVYAYWIGPWEGNTDILKYFTDVREFNQLLVRAGIRMLLIKSEFKVSDELERYTKATELIASYVKG